MNDTVPTQEMMEGYMNPYQDAVSAEINRAYDQQLAQARSRSAGQAGGPSAFGGSRARGPGAVSRTGEGSRH